MRLYVAGAVTGLGLAVLTFVVAAFRLIASIDR